MARPGSLRVLRDSSRRIRSGERSYWSASRRSSEPGSRAGRSSRARLHRRVEQVAMMRLSSEDRPVAGWP